MMRAKNEFYRVLVLIYGFLIGQNANETDYRFDKIVLIKNAQIWVDYKTRLDTADLVISNGKILKVGKKLTESKEMEVLDYSGKFIYPSFVETYSNYGISDVKSVSGTKPHYESTTKGAFYKNQAIKAEVNSAHIFKNDFAKAKQFRELGFGTVVTCNQDGIVRGSSCTVLLNEMEEGKNLIDLQTSLNLSFNKGSSTQEYPTSLMGTIALLRQVFYDAIAYADKKLSNRQDLSLEALVRLKSRPWVFDVGSSNGILRAEKISTEFGKKLIVLANGDEFQNLPQLQKSQVHFLVSLNFPEPYKVSNLSEAQNLSDVQLMDWYFAPQNISLLANKGLEFSITTAKLKDLKDFDKNLKRVFENQVDESIVLKALTFNPANNLGIYDKVGSIQIGKYANFIVTEHKLSDPKFKVLENWVAGEKYAISKPTLFLSEKYTLKIDSIEDLIIEVSLKEEPRKIQVYSAKEKGDTTKFKCTLLGEENGKVEMVLELGKLNPELSHKIYLKGFIQNGTIIRGQVVSFDFSQNRKFTMTPFTIGDNHKLQAKKDSVTNSKTKNKLEIPFPFNSFGDIKFRNFRGFIVRNATVWTSEENFEIFDCDVLVVDGKIKSIGKSLKGGNELGFQIEEIDGRGKYITAGIIDEHSHIALNGGVNESGQSVTSEVRVSDVINPHDINIYRQVAGGVTTSHLLHGSANCIGGQSALINLKWGKTVDEMLFKGNVPFIKFALGENVKQSNWGDKYILRYPQTRMGVEQTIKDAFQRAKEYRMLQEEALKSKKTDLMPNVDLELEAIAEILEKKRMVTCHSYSQSEINMLMKLAESYGFHINTFTHVLEGYKIADKIKLHGAGASSFSDWWSFKAEVKDAIPQNASILTRHGVVSAINSDDPEMGRRLNQEAAKSVKYGGLSQPEAWSLVTINPAKLLKIDKYVGSVKEGKIANLVIWSGNPLSVYSKAERTFIEGICYFDILENERLINSDQKRRNIIIGELLNDKSPESDKRPMVIEKPEHYHCDDF